jgi:acyl-coenzyme A synthetase/AMP-(fatty) acid ligase
VTLKGGNEGSVEFLAELRDHVAEKIGPIAKPRMMASVSTL